MMTQGEWWQREIWARDKAGQWHRALESYPNSAKTVCGKDVICDRVVAFTAGSGLAAATQELRPLRCQQCASLSGAWA